MNESMIKLFASLNEGMPLKKMALATELYIMLLTYQDIPKRYSLPIAKRLILFSDDVRLICERIVEEYDYYDQYLNIFKNTADDEAETLAYISEKILKELWS